jgi:hypothetical protein
MSFDRIKKQWTEYRNQERLRRQLAEQLSRTPAGRFASEVDRVARTRSATKATADRLRRQFTQLTAGANREATSRLAVSRQLADIERYAARTPGGAWGWMSKVFGPIADAIKGLLRPMGLQRSTREIEQAAELLNALGASTEGARGRRVRVESADNRAREDAERILESLGFDIDRGASPVPIPPELRLPDPTAPPSAPPRTPSRLPPIPRNVPDDPTSGMVRRMLNGMFVYFRPDDPIVTGAMIHVRSSNVHSIGFIWNDKTPEKGTLKVRYLDKSKGNKSSTQGGPTYFYYDVHPRVFFDFQRASSMGRFVWDRLRIRGTVSGHQFRYGLGALSSTGYVPRQATRIGNEEHFLGRSVRTRDNRTLRSQQADRFVRHLTPQQQALPASAFPNTGRPRSGSR